MFGESPPLPGLGLAKATAGYTDYTILNATYLEPLTGTEVVIEASTPVVAPIYAEPVRLPRVPRQLMSHML